MQYISKLFCAFLPRSHLSLPFFIFPLLTSLFLQSLQDLEDEGDMLQDLQTRRQQRKEEVHNILPWPYTVVLNIISDTRKSNSGISHIALKLT